jgi:hypothetical protein
MAGALKVLAVHGVGRHLAGGPWQKSWSDAIETSVTGAAPDRQVKTEFVTYDDLFQAEDITALGTLEAVGKLLGSGIRHGIGDTLGGIFGRARAPTRAARGLPDRLRWTAGMVVQWIENEKLRRKTRERLAAAVLETKPDVVCAHSLGSLIAYDTFIQPRHKGLMAARAFITFGSQIGNAFVRSQYAGRIRAIDCEHWYHLYNPEDDIFTAPIRLFDKTFEQIDCFFDIVGLADHDAATYLAHPNARTPVWLELLSAKKARRTPRRERGRIHRGGEHKQRALLIGINDYPDPESRLEGCVNDVFLMSEVLQEHGFAARQIRTVLDNRATADGIRSRIEWLLDSVQAGDRRVLYYSGHGAQIPDYGPDEAIDRMDECLVPWDFEWSRETAIMDDWFHELYSQLPYDTRFRVILDCCHSGGMTRAGIGRPRGLNPPDDIRHRDLEWDPKTRVWQARRLESPSKALIAPAVTKAGLDYLGKSGTLRRFGRAVDLVTTLTNKEYDKACQTFGHRGPYLPVLLQACQEDQLAFEYRHGATSYGAFTFTLAQQLRRTPVRPLGVRNLCADIALRLIEMNYDQQPNVVAPGRLLDRPLFET